jgi:hypothetical protein
MATRASMEAAATRSPYSAASCPTSGSSCRCSWWSRRMAPPGATARVLRVLGVYRPAVDRNAVAVDVFVDQRRPCWLGRREQVHRRAVASCSGHLLSRRTSGSSRYPAAAGPAYSARAGPSCAPGPPSNAARMEHRAEPADGPEGYPWRPRLRGSAVAAPRAHRRRRAVGVGGPEGALPHVPPHPICSHPTASVPAGLIAAALLSCAALAEARACPVPVVGGWTGGSSDAVTSGTVRGVTSRRPNDSRPHWRTCGASTGAGATVESFRPPTPRGRGGQGGCRSSGGAAPTSRRRGGRGSARPAGGLAPGHRPCAVRHRRARLPLRVLDRDGNGGRAAVLVPTLCIGVVPAC